MHEWKRWVLVPAILVALVSAPALAQEGGEDEGEDFGLWVDLGVFIAKPNGVGFRPATEVDPFNPSNAVVLPFDFGTETEARLKAGYDFEGWGTVFVEYYEQKSVVERIESSPGNYIYGTLTVSPLYAGFNNDGLADAFRAGGVMSLRDLRMMLKRPAFENDMARGSWFVGIRRIQHNRRFDASYFALLTDLPNFSEPLCGADADENCPDLDPLADRSLTTSNYRGRGIEGGLEVDFPLVGDKLIIESSFSAAAMFGDIDTQYNSTTYFYEFTGSGAQTSVLEAPYTTLDDPAIFGNTLQRPFNFGINQTNDTVSSLVLDGWLGLRAEIWREIEFFVGYRITRYGDVAVELQPGTPAVDGGVNPNVLEEVSRSVTYEGLYTGLGIRF